MKDFILPDIGEGIVECELLKWLVKEGETIKEDQAVAEVMTDKATVEIPAMHDGVVLKLYHQEGDIAKVHEPLFAMSDDSGDTQQVSSVDNSNGAGDKISQPTNTSKVVNGNIEAFILPDIGEGIVECEIMQWHVGEGDDVKEDQVVVEVMTDKAVVEIPAKFDGRIVKLHYQKGDIAAVHTPLFDQIIVGASTQSQHQTASTTSQNNSADAVVQTNATANTMLNEQRHTQSSYKQGENFTPPKEVARAIASPAVRRLAREKGVSLNNISATGPKGRVLKQDVLDALSVNSGDTQTTENAHQQSSSTSNINTHTSQDQAKNTVDSKGTQNRDRVEPIKGIRAAMAKQMMASVSSIPHFSVSDELCMDNLISLRSKLKSDFASKGIKLSFMPFFIKALSLAMQSFPIVNSRLNNDATELTYLASHNVGLAVDSKIGLLVPNIKNVQDLSLFEVAQEVNRLIDRAREGKLSNTDLSGGTISISNIGAIGGITATPVINKPDVAIVALGKTQKLPRFTEQGEVVASNIMMVNWSGDHRVIDGATMVKFNNLWMDYLSNPEKMLVHLR